MIGYKPLLYFLLFLLLPGIHSTALAQENRLPAPPNGIWLQDNLFIDRTEVSNLHWQEYLYFLQQDSSFSVYLKALPDTTVWNAIDTSGHFMEQYLRDPAYQHMAVVGISYEQVQDYCKWRSAAVNAALAKKALEQEQLPAYRVSYRLPSREEWEMAAAGELDPQEYPFGRQDYLKRPEFKQSPEELYARSDSELSFREFKRLIRRFKRKGRVPEFNCVKSVNGILDYSNLMPEAVHSLAENTLSIRGMIGNVAEMTTQRGIAKGGSFLHRCEDCRIQKYQEYIRPEAWLGFRCIAEVELLP